VTNVAQIQNGRSWRRFRLLPDRHSRALKTSHCACLKVSHRFMFYFIHLLLRISHYYTLVFVFKENISTVGIVLRNQS